MHFVEVGEKSVGKETFDGLLTKEFARREAEYKTQGQDQWCADTEGFLRKLGITDVFQ